MEGLKEVLWKAEDLERIQHADITGWMASETDRVAPSGPEHSPA